MQYVFGAGLLFAQPEGADTGATTPIQVGAMRGVSVDMGFSVKDLHGDGRPWPLAIGRGTGKITCTAEFAQLTAEGFNLLLFGGPQPTVGSTCVAVEEPHVVSANSALPTYAASFGGDLGIVAALPAGNMFYRVASSPGPREYTCNDVTGAYGFGGSDGEAVLISYVYTDASNGRLISIANKNIGHTPRFSVVLTETFNGKHLTLTLTSCSTSRLGFTSKMEDFTIPQFSFSAAADDGGIVGTLSVAEGAPDAESVCTTYKALSSAGWRYMQVARSDTTNYSGVDTSSWANGPTPFAGKDGGVNPSFPAATLWVTHTRMWLALPIIGTPGLAYTVRIPSTIDDTINVYWNGATLLTQPDGDSLGVEVNVAVPRGLCTGNDVLVLQAVDRTATGHPGPGEFCFVDVEVIGCT